MAAAVSFGSIGITVSRGESCLAGSLVAGLCTSGSSDGDSATIQAGRTSSGGSSVSTAGASGGLGNQESATDSTLDDCAADDCLHIPAPRELLKGQFGDNTGIFVFPEQGTPPKKGAPAAPAAPPRIVTSNDVARFVPPVGQVQGEPNGWAVVGVPANYRVQVGQAVVEGEIFDTPAEVRFTPYGYNWAYGDGTTRVSTTPGATWAQLGQRELTETPTSHIYGGRAKRAVRVQVVYSAEYRVGDSDWIPVQGAVTAVSAPTPVRVVVERTALTPN